MSEIILEYTRAGHVENIHRADVVAVNCKGDILKEAGNGRLPMFWRSAAKPFQALAFVKNGGLEKYGLTDRELAFLGVLPQRRAFPCGAGAGDTGEAGADY